MRIVKRISPGFSSLVLVLLLGFHLIGADFFRERENALKPGRWQLGPFQVFPVLTLENVGYTDNVYGYIVEPQPGWMADLGAKIKAVAVAGQRLVFAFEGHPYYSYFSAVDTERAFNYSLNGKVYTYLAGLHLMYGFNYGNTRSRPNREFAARVRSYSTSHNIEMDIGNHSALFLTLYARHTQMDFADEGFMERFSPGVRLNRSERDVGVKINLPVFTATLMFFQAELRQYRFDSFSERNGESLTTTANIRFPEIGHLNGSASLGYKRYFPDAPGYAQFDTLYGSGRISYRFLRRLRLQFEYGVDNNFSFLNPEYYYNERSVQAGLDYYLTENFRLGGSYRTGQHKYRRLADDALQYIDNYTQFEVRMAYRLKETTGVGLSFRRQEWDSQRYDLQRSQYFIGGFITYDF